MRILVANNKGGVGKSTVAVNIASEIAKSGTVRFIDLDFTNQTSSEFYEDREDIQCLEPHTIDEIVEAYQKDGDVVIDSGGFETELNRAVISTADVILIPYRTGDLEERALLKFLAIINEIGTIRGNRIILVPNAVHHNQTYDKIKSNIKPLLDMGYEMSHPINQSANFVKAMNKFKTVYEYGAMTQYEQILAIVKRIKDK